MITRPMLYSAPMVRALLDGTKTQTRRVLKVQPPTGTTQFCTYHYPDPRKHHWAMDDDSLLDFAVPCRYGEPGDQIWVRENHAPPQPDCWGAWDAWMRDDTKSPKPIIHYQADGGEPWVEKWRPSIHMPRWASRITLEITQVRVERLQDISRGDAMAEGCPFPNMAAGPDPRQWYAELWDQINGPGAWALNPWVWAVSFKRLKP
jgi:hypothetical protein